jgi:hypothetical protein
LVWALVVAKEDSAQPEENDAVCGLIGRLGGLRPAPKPREQLAAFSST